MQSISLYLMAIFYFAISLSHFLKHGFFLKLIPPQLPFPKLLNYLSGLVEFALAVLLLIPEARVWASWRIIAFLVLALPIKIYIYKNPDLKTPCLDEMVFLSFLYCVGLVAYVSLAVSSTPAESNLGRTLRIVFFSLRRCVTWILISKAIFGRYSSKSHKKNLGIASKAS